MSLETLLGLGDVSEVKKVIKTERLGRLRISAVSGGDYKKHQDKCRNVTDKKADFDSGRRKAYCGYTSLQPSKGRVHGFGSVRRR